MSTISGVDKVVGKLIISYGTTYKCVKAETVNGYKFFFQNVHTLIPYNSPNNAEFRVSLTMRDEFGTISVRHTDYIGVESLTVNISEISSFDQFIVMVQNLITKFNEGIQ
jgi:hypothetical protein